MNCLIVARQNETIYNMNKTTEVILPKFYSPSSDTGRCYVYFSVRNYSTGKMVRHRIYSGFAGVTIADKRKDAQKLINQLTEKLKKGWRPSVSKSVELDDKLRFDNVITQTLAKKERTVRWSTYVGYKSKFKAFKSWLDHMTIEYVPEFDEERADEFFLYLIKDKGLSNGSHNDYVTALNILFKPLLQRKLIASSPTRFIERLRKTNRPAKYISREDLKLISSHLRKNDPHFWLFLQFVFYLFIRPHSELRYMKISWIDFEHQNVTIPGDIAKNHKTATLPIPKPLFEQLEFLRSYRSDYYIFTLNECPGKKHISKNHYQRKFRDLRSLLNLPTEYSIYSFKHTGAIMVTRLNKVSTKELQMQLRHHSLDMVDRYIRQMIAIDSTNLREGFPSI